MTVPESAAAVFERVLGELRTLIETDVVREDREQTLSPTRRTINTDGTCDSCSETRRLVLEAGAAWLCKPCADLDRFVYLVYRELPRLLASAAQVTQALGTTGGLTESERAILRRVDTNLRSFVVSGAPSTVRVEAGDWTTVEHYVERILAARLAAPDDLRDKVLALADERLRDLIDRLDRADAELSLLEAKRQRADEVKRIKGKREGVRLARSYAAENLARALVGDGGGAL